MYLQFNDICGVFSDASGEYEEPQPVVVSRNTQEDRNPFGSTFCYGTDQIVVEVCIFIAVPRRILLLRTFRAFKLLKEVVVLEKKH